MKRLGRKLSSYHVCFVVLVVHSNSRDSLQKKYNETNSTAWQAHNVDINQDLFSINTFGINITLIFLNYFPKKLFIVLLTRMIFPNNAID
jgi:hypothetical protein